MHFVFIAQYIKILLIFTGKSVIYFVAKKYNKIMNYNKFYLRKSYKILKINFRALKVKKLLFVLIHKVSQLYFLAFDTLLLKYFYFNENSDLKVGIYN